MSLSVATWNINSVRLRINNVKRYLRLRKPDVLCLQETKCPDEFFPHKAFEGLGYTHRLVQGMKSYNGVAIVSKVPFRAVNIHLVTARCTLLGSYLAAQNHRRLLREVFE